MSAAVSLASSTSALPGVPPPTAAAAAAGCCGGSTLLGAPAAAAAAQPYESPAEGNVYASKTELLEW